VILTDGPPPQHHEMRGVTVGAEFFEMWNASGELILLLDDSEVALKPGDVVVQRGTNHAWENRSDKIARAAFFHIDAQFSEELLAKLPKPLELLR
jgi:hypothetical protein